MKRRTVLKTAGLAAGAAFVPARFSIGQSGPSANEKLNIAMIGAGNIAGMAYGGCWEHNIVALADVDSNMFLQKAEQFPHLHQAKQFTDFRVMLDKMDKEIDAVCINTPDHTHFVATLDAMRRGKHVCTQKPLTHNIWEARMLRKAKDKYGVVTNMANQGHTFNGIRQMREWYEADVFGQVREVHMGFPGPHWESPYFKKPTQIPIPGQPVPEGLNWDLWLGPSTFPREYNEIFHPLTWRGFYEFGTGQFGDWFCHIGDGAVWTLDLYEPTVVECVEQCPSYDGMLPNHSVIRFDFPARGKKEACSMFWYDGMANAGRKIKTPEEWDYGTDAPQHGSYWYGDKFNAYLDERSNNPRLASKVDFKEFKLNRAADIPEKYPRVEGGPFAEWTRAIKGDGPEPGSNFDYAAPMSEVALIGVLAQRFGGRIEWDSKKMEVTNRPELNAFVKEPIRNGWDYSEYL